MRVVHSFFTRLSRCKACFAVLALLLLHGCAPARPDNSGRIVLTLWSMWSGQEEQNFQRVLALYEKQHPGVVIRNLGGVGDDTKTIRALVAGVPPDVFTLADPAYLGTLARNHALLPLDTLFQQSHLRADAFVPASLTLCRYQNQLYGMPFLLDDIGLLWDKRAFQQAGLDPERPPRTLEDLADLAVRLTEHDNAGKITRLGMRSAIDTGLLFALFNGKLVDESGRITADDPANVAALTWYKQLIDRMGGTKNVREFESGYGHDQGTGNPFYVGNFAFEFNGEWNPYWIARYAPQIRYGVAAPPRPAALSREPAITGIGGNLFCIPKDCRHAKEAWDFLVWLQSPEAQILFAHDNNNVPNQKAALQSPELRTGPPFRQKFATFMDLATVPQNQTFPTLPVATLYHTELSNAVDTVLLGDKTPAQALRDVRVRVQRQLDQQ